MDTHFQGITVYMIMEDFCSFLFSVHHPSTRHGVKYIEMYLNTNTNTFEGFKYKYF